MTTSERHVLTEAELEANLWASCGPAALAALLGRPLAEIQHAFPEQHVGRTWTNLGHMAHALRALGVTSAMTPWAGVPDLGPVSPRAWPRCGLVLVQFCGPWSKLAVNHPAQLHRTHWVATAPAGHPVGDRFLTMPGVFDVNQVCAPLAPQHGWTSRRLWEEYGAPLIAEHLSKRSTGAWWVRAGLEVDGISHVSAVFHGLRQGSDVVMRRTLSPDPLGDGDGIEIESIAVIDDGPGG